MRPRRGPCSRSATATPRPCSPARSSSGSSAATGAPTASPPWPTPSPASFTCRPLTACSMWGRGGAGPGCTWPPGPAVRSSSPTCPWKGCGWPPTAPPAKRSCPHERGGRGRQLPTPHPPGWGQRLLLRPRPGRPPPSGCRVGAVVVSVGVCHPLGPPGPPRRLRPLARTPPAGRLLPGVRPGQRSPPPSGRQTHRLPAAHPGQRYPHPGAGVAAHPSPRDHHPPRPDRN
jgi:hypothetical protein